MSISSLDVHEDGVNRLANIETTTPEEFEDEVVIIDLGDGKVVVVNVAGVKEKVTNFLN
jgi:hypothetical protein